MQICFWLFGAVLTVFVVQRTLAALPEVVPAGVKRRHYVFTSFLVFMNASGLSWVNWTVRRLFTGDSVSQLEQHFIALAGLSPNLAVAILLYCGIGKCIMLILAFGMAKSTSNSRTVLLKLYPFLVLADATSFCIDYRGDQARTGVQYLIAISIWGIMVGWIYVWAFRFYRGPRSDVLFLSDKDETLQDVANLG